MGPDTMTWLPFVMIAVVVVVIAIGAWRWNVKRRREAQAFAAARGWTFTQNVPALVSRWRSDPFARGHGRRAYNVMTGSFHGRQVVSMEYQYSTGSGKNRSTYTYDVTALSLPVAMPWLRLSPDRAGAAVAKFFGGQDIEFESHAFNEAWRVQAPPGQYAYDIIHPRMMDRLMESDAVGLTIVIENTDIFVVTSGSRSLSTIDYRVNLLYGLVDLVPRHLWLRLGYDPSKEDA